LNRAREPTRHGRPGRPRDATAVSAGNLRRGSLPPSPRLAVAVCAPPSPQLAVAVCAPPSPRLAVAVCRPRSVL